MKGMAAAFGSRRRYEAAQRLARLGRGPLAKAAVPGWTAMRDLPEPPKETFRDWWKREHGAHRTRHPRRRARGAPRPTSSPRPRASARARARDPARATALAGALPRDGIVDLFCERVAEYRATVHRVADVAADRPRDPRRRRARSASRASSPTSAPSSTTRPLRRRPRHARRRRHRLRARDRRHRHDRARLRPAPPAAARSRSSPTTTSASSRRATSSPPSPTPSPRWPGRRGGPPDHARLRPVRHLRHRARPRRRRPRPAHARRDRRRIGKPTLQASNTCLLCPGDGRLPCPRRARPPGHPRRAPDRDGQTLFELCARLTASTASGCRGRRSRSTSTCSNRPAWSRPAGTAGTSSTTSTPRRSTRSSGGGREPTRNEDHVTSVFVDDQEKALAFYTDVLGFVKKNDIPLGEHRWLTVVSPEDAGRHRARCSSPTSTPPRGPFKARARRGRHPVHVVRRRRRERRARAADRARRPLHSAADGDGARHHRRPRRHVRQPDPDRGHGLIKR